MAAVDNIQIISTATGDKWAAFEKLPSGHDFIQAFNIQQSHPKKGPSCITAFFHLISTKKINDIKHETIVYEHLRS
eukprot:6835643-Ditylum_brightwellii.AAC.1